MARIDEYEPEDLDLDFPARAFFDEEAMRQSLNEPHERRPRVPRKPRPRWLAVVLVVAFLTLNVGIPVALGHWWGAADGVRIARDAMLETAEAQNLAGAATDSAAFWKKESKDTSDTIKALRSELTSATAAAELYRLRSEDASQTIAAIQQQKATKAPAAPKVTQTAYTGSYDTSGVEQWRGLVASYFPPQNVDAALSVMWKESRGNPNAKNSSSGASGLFQQMPAYWSSRLAAAEKTFGKDFNDSIFDPEANVAASAVLSNGGRNWSHWSVKP